MAPRSLLLAFLLVSASASAAGCAGGGEPSDAPSTSGAAAGPVGDAPEASLGPKPEVVAWDGHITVAAGAGGPLGYQGAAPQDPPHSLAVPEGTTALVLELVWKAAGQVPAQPLHLRAISPEAAYVYGGAGAGTAQSPDRLAIDAPAAGTWTVEALVKEGVAADQDYTVHASFFAGFPVPEGYNSFLANATAAAR